VVFWERIHLQHYFDLRRMPPHAAAKISTHVYVCYELWPLSGHGIRVGNPTTTTALPKSVLSFKMGAGSSRMGVERMREMSRNFRCLGAIRKTR
jgi:hypothetical protein